jgi:DNA-nicking Smr family endonuclease
VSDDGDGDDEFEAWRRAVEDVRPIARRPRALRKATTGTSRATSRSGRGGLPPLQEGSAPDTNPKDWARIRRGELRFEASVDLHGYTRAEAGVALRAFLVACHRRGVRVVRVVTGKGLGSGPGGSVLRAAIAAWINAGDVRPIVLGFCAAVPSDGGAGAVYVWLRSPGAHPPSGR